MSVVGNILASVVIVTVVITAYFFISFSQTQDFGKQVDSSQTVFYEHKIAEDLAGILKTKEPRTGLPLIELIGYEMYYKKSGIQYEFYQLNIQPTIKDVFDSLYGEENYYLEVEPKDIDVRMVFIVDGSKSMADDLERLTQILPELIHSFEGTGQGIEPVVYILKRAQSSFDCQTTLFDWTYTLNGIENEIKCIDGDDPQGEELTFTMSDVYNHPQFNNIENLATVEYEDWASATAFLAMRYAESTIASTTMFFPLSDELASGSEQDEFKQPDYSSCQLLYSAQCCNDLQYYNGMPYCNSVKTECQIYQNEPEKCGYYYQSLSNVYSCWAMDTTENGGLGLTNTGYNLQDKCNSYKFFVEVCSDKQHGTEYQCGTQRSADVTENAIRIIKSLERPDFYIFPIKTSPCYPSLNPPNNFSACTGDLNFGYQCWTPSQVFYNLCTGSGPCCTQSANTCPACRLDTDPASPDYQKACVRENCDKPFSITIDGQTTDYSADNQEDISQHMKLLAQASSNTDGNILDISGLTDISLFQNKLRQIVEDISDHEFKLGTYKPLEERYVTEQIIPLSNATLTKAKLWLYKDRVIHLIEDANSSIQRVNYAPEAKFFVYPMPYCHEMDADNKCHVTFDGRDSDDLNFDDNEFGESLTYAWSIVADDDATINYGAIGMPSTNCMNEAATIDELLNCFSLDLPSNAENERFYDISLTVTDRENLSDTATLQNYCVGSECAPDMIYNFVPVKWNVDYAEYLEAAQSECHELKQSMPCSPDLIECRCVPKKNIDDQNNSLAPPFIVCDSPEADNQDSSHDAPANSCDVAPIGDTTCVALNGSAVLPAIHNCAEDWGMADPNISWTNNQRNVGLMPNGMPFCQVGGVVGYTFIYYTTAVDRTGYPYIAVHEMGHTYGLCDEYRYDTWVGENGGVNGGACPNPWPGQVSGCGGLSCGDSCEEVAQGQWTCLSAMGPAIILGLGDPHNIPNGSIVCRDYDVKEDHDGTTLGVSDSKHIQAFVQCSDDGVNPAICANG